MTEKIFPYELPKDWRWVKLKSIAEIVTGSTPSKKISSYYGGNFPFFKPADLNAGRHTTIATEYLSEKGKKMSKIIPKGSIAVCCIGSIGKCGYLEVEGTTNQQINSIIPKINSLYVYYYCLTDFFVNELIEKSSATTISIVNKSKMADCNFPLPPLDKQKKIVERIESLFSKLDSAKSILQKILDGYELRRAAILHKAFTGELTENFRAENNLSLDDWQEKTLGEVCKINPPKISTANLSDNLEVSFFPMSSLSEVEGKIVNPQIKLLGKVKSGYTNFSEGDVVFAKITPCMENGKSAVIEKLVNDIGFGTTEFFVMRCGEQIFNKFLYHLVRSKKFRTEAKEVMAGAVGQQRVQKKFLTAYEINLPPLAEQKEIVRVLDSLLDKEQRTKDIAENILQEIDLLKKSILARAFRGEL